ncbi:DUF1273 domain-containing protein [Jeotgalibacillus soli]|uniref:UPF0398 protein KP78_31240 n=1 Tax=Jeotgalibacillus soli TaxID=889306 RepID=A0A0C2R1H9_9BACL|nr:DUF1273 domain-containing protein [Jeotgalibacillus soli]KIL44160.1 hypothetical protein KP78_31240 [Jeotgalibacillus soli]
MKVLTISGYKSQEIGVFKQTDPALFYIKKAIKQILLQRIEEGLEWVIISGQLGVELWAGEVVLELKELYPNLSLAILTAYADHELKWNEANQEMYKQIANQADFVEAISKKPYENPQQLSNKNKFLITKSDGLLMVYDEEHDGSPKYLWQLAKQYQENHSYEIIQVTFQDLQLIVEEEQWNNRSFNTD